MDFSSALALVWIALVGDGALVAYFVIRARRKIRAIGRTSVLPCGAGEEHAGQEVWLRGSAASGPDGPVTAPISASECVWFITRTVEYTSSFWGSPTPKAGRLDWHRSSAPFVLRDSSGEATVFPEGLALEPSPDSRFDVIRADRLVKTANDFEKNPRLRRRGAGDRGREEWILPEGSDVYVKGAVERGVDGVVVSKPLSGNFLITLVAPDDELRDQKALVWILTLLVFPGCLVLAYIVGLGVQLI
ncbi:GIDE domain-containing protein [Spirillospora sp. CA-142024]|uniref:GIDE domain-containing protein n=1 Tax=Spirillospora sp. CA-142024 TaxID=3240036 RepID=UPI003D8D1EE3